MPAPLTPYFEFCVLPITPPELQQNPDDSKMRLIIEVNLQILAIVNDMLPTGYFINRRAHRREIELSLPKDMGKDISGERGLYTMRFEPCGNEMSQISWEKSLSKLKIFIGDLEKHLDGTDNIDCLHGEGQSYIIRYEDIHMAHALSNLANEKFEHDMGIKARLGLIGQIYERIHYTESFMPASKMN